MSIWLLPNLAIGGPDRATLLSMSMRSMPGTDGKKPASHAQLIRGKSSKYIEDQMLHFREVKEGDCDEPNCQRIQRSRYQVNCFILWQISQQIIKEEK